MGWRRVLISMKAAARQAEREDQRERRQTERNHKMMLKQLAVADAYSQVNQQQAQLDALASTHQQATPRISWKEINDSPPPRPPVRGKTGEESAHRALSSFRPTIFDRIFRTSEKKIQKLRQDVERARKADEEAFFALASSYERTHALWAQNKQVSRMILDGDQNAFVNVLKERTRLLLTDLPITKLSFAPLSKGQVLVEVGVHPVEFIPREQKRQLRNGALSLRPFPKAEFNKIYSDYVCGISLRLAREVLAIVPFSGVVVNANTKLLDAGSGRLLERTILSIMLPRSSIEEFDWVHVDPTHALERIKHASGLKKTAPPEAIQPLDNAATRSQDLILRAGAK